MAFSIQKLPNEPIVIMTLRTDSGSGEKWEWDSFIKEFDALLDAQQEPVFYLIDVSRADVDLERMIQGVNLTTSGRQPMLKHPNIRENLIITTSKFFKLAVKGMNTIAFGNIEIKVFDDMDACLRYCRQ